jgi:hypothetical protein
MVKLTINKIFDRLLDSYDSIGDNHTLPRGFTSLLKDLAFQLDRFDELEKRDEKYDIKDFS